MKNNILESVTVTILILLFIYVTYETGYAISERKHCIADNGHYSFDYFECIKEKKSETRN